MRYVIYTVDRYEEVFGNADVHDSYIVDSALERNQYLMEEVKRDTCIQVMYAPIYKSGEYGKRVIVKLYNVVDFTGIELEVLVKLGGIL